MTSVSSGKIFLIDHGLAVTFLPLHCSHSFSLETMKDNRLVLANERSNACRCAQSQKLSDGASRAASLTSRFLFSDLDVMDSFLSVVGSGSREVEVMPAECSPRQSQKTLYYCPKCLHGFTLKSNRNRHFRYECGHEPRFKCPYCDLRSKQTSQVYSHIRKKHSTERVWVIDLKS